MKLYDSSIMLGRTVWRVSALAMLFVLFACASSGGIQKAIITTPKSLASYPVVELKTSGKFWGFGNDGRYTLGKNYNGKFDRAASNSSFLGGFVSSNKTSIAASVNNVTTKRGYVIACSGGESGINFDSFSFSLGGDKSGDFDCIISRNKKKVGSYVIKSDSGLIGPKGKVKGTAKLGRITYAVESVHKTPDMVVPVDQVLGYYVKERGKVIGVVQANGGVSLQNAPLSASKMDLLVLTVVASGLRIPAE